jgi:hypothetical protein
MTFEGIVNDVIDMCSQDQGGDFEKMTKAAINRVYRRLLRITDTETEKREFSLTTADGTSQYGMPLEVRQVLNIEDGTNQNRIYDISWRDFDDLYPGDTTEGQPRKAYPLGEFGVYAQPDSTAVLDMASTDTTDTGNHFVQVVGRNASGYLTRELVTINGQAVVSTTNTYATIERLTKYLDSDSASWGGNIEVTGGSGIPLTQIPVYWESASHLWYEFWPIPDAAYTFTVRAIARKPDLLFDQDWPQIHEDYHPLILQGALAELLPILGKEEVAATVARDYFHGIEEMKGSNQNRPNAIRVFSDIMNSPVMPQRPWIEGIDY